MKVEVMIRNFTNEVKQGASFLVSDGTEIISFFKVLLGRGKTLVDSYRGVLLMLLC